MQVGPYSFKEYHKKTNISFSPDGNLVDFNQMKYWVFDPENSGGDLSDEIWTLNMIAVSAAESTRCEKDRMIRLVFYTRRYQPLTMLEHGESVWIPV